MGAIPAKAVEGGKPMRSKTHNIIHAALLTGIGVAFVGCQSVPNLPVDTLSSGARGARPAAGQAAGENGAAATSGDAASAGAVGTTGATNGGATGQAGVAPQAGAVAEGTLAAGAEANKGAAAQAGAAEPVVPDAKITGRVVDTKGAPIEGITVNTYYGFKATTGADGKFTIDVKAEPDVRLDLNGPKHLNRQVALSVIPGEVGELNVTLKALDPKLIPVTAAAGGNLVNSDGSAELRIPPGALTQDGAVRLTWMDPMPSDQFPFAHGELPAPLVTRSLPNGEDAGEAFNIPPIAFTNVQLTHARIAPGAQLELRMRVNPNALDLAGRNIDFANPATLQQPCYDFNRAMGVWGEPATSRVERDADGTAWFVYTMRGQGATPNLFNLLQYPRVRGNNLVTGSQVVSWQENVTRWAWRTVYWSEPVDVWVDDPGGGGSWVTQWVQREGQEQYSYTERVTRSRVDYFRGKDFIGQVLETSSNSSLNGRPLAGATVRHEQDFRGATTKTSDGNGEFVIPMWHNSPSVSVNGAGFGNAQSTVRGRKLRQATGFVMDVNTDSEVRLAPSGPDFGSAHYGRQFQVQYRIDGAVRNETVTFGPNRDWIFGRDTSDNVNNYALVSVSNDTFTYVPEGSLPSTDLSPGGTATYGLRMYNRVANTGRVTERSSNSALNGQPLVGATVRHNTDFFGATQKVTGAGGSFTIPLYNATTQVGGASYYNASAPSGGFDMTIDTDSRLNLTLTGDFNPALHSNEEFEITYRIDGRQVTETVTFNPGRGFSFGRDAGDNMNNWELVSLQNPMFLYEPSAGVLPTSSLRPGATGAHSLRVKFVAAK